MLQVEEEFTPHLQRLMSTNEFINADAGMIKLLVSSEHEYEQRRGEVRYRCNCAFVGNE